MTNNDELALKLAKLAKNAGADEWQAKKISGDQYVIRKGSYRVESGFCTYQEIAEIDDNSTRVFVACASPANILALLAERDADKKQIRSWSCIAKKNIEEHEKAVNALDAARQRIAELEQSNCGGALMDSKPVGYYRKASDGFYLSSATIQREGTVPLYAAPPAAAVPDNVLQALREMDDEIIAELDAEESDCRAAMLKAWPVTGWIKCSERMPDETQPVITVAEGGVVQRTVYQFCDGVWVDWYEQYDEVKVDAFTHWMPLPAAPDQEV